MNHEIHSSVANSTDALVFQGPRRWAVARNMTPDQLRISTSYDHLRDGILVPRPIHRCWLLEPITWPTSTRILRTMIWHDDFAVGSKPVCEKTSKHRPRTTSAVRDPRCVAPNRAFAHKAYFATTARTAFGFVLAIARRVRAAPLGCLRPCSQPCKVRTETPSKAANWD